MTVKGLEKWGDRIKECPVSNGRTLYYVSCGGLDFEVGIYCKDENETVVYTQVDNCLMTVLSECHRQKRRVRVWYGTGFKDYQTTGYIGRSCGLFKVPMIIFNSRSCSGRVISVSSLVRVDDTRTHKVLWRASNHCGKMELFYVKGNELPWQVCDRNNATPARFKTEKQARRWIDFQRQMAKAWGKSV